jgi:hypothetical protein
MPKIFFDKIMFKSKIANTLWRGKKEIFGIVLHGQGISSSKYTLSSDPGCTHFDPAHTVFVTGQYLRMHNYNGYIYLPLAQSKKHENLHGWRKKNAELRVTKTSHWQKK